MRSRWKTWLAAIVFWGMTAIDLRASMVTAADFDCYWVTTLGGHWKAGIIGHNGVSLLCFGDRLIRLPFPAPVAVGVLAGVPFAVMTGAMIFSRRGKKHV